MLVEQLADDDAALLARVLSDDTQWPGECFPDDRHAEGLVKVVRLDVFQREGRPAQIK